MTSSEGFQTSEVESKREKTDLPLQSWRRLNLGLGRKGTSCESSGVLLPQTRCREAAEGTPAPESQTAAPHPRAQGREHHPVTSSSIKCTRGRVLSGSVNTRLTLVHPSRQKPRPRVGGPRLTLEAQGSGGASPRVPGSLAGLGAPGVAPLPSCALPTRRRQRGWWGRWSASEWPPSRSPLGCGPRSRGRGPGAWWGRSPRGPAAAASSCGRQPPGLRGASSWPPSPGPACASARGRRGGLGGRGLGPGRRSSRRRPCCVGCAGRTGV